MTTKKKPRAERTKADIEAARKKAFQAFTQNIANTEDQSLAAQQEYEELTLQAVQWNMEELTRHLTEAQLSTTSALDRIREMVIVEFNRLQSVRKLVRYEQAAHDQLYGQDAYRVSIAELDREWKQKAEELGAKYEAMHKAAEVEHAAHLRGLQDEAERVRMALDAEIREQRTMWLDEKYEHERAIKVRQEVFEQQAAELDRLLKVETESIARDEEIVDLKAQISAASAKHNAIRHELETKLALAEQRVTSLEAALDERDTRLRGLEQDLAAARAEVKEIATAAFRESGASRALAEMQSRATDNQATRSRT